MKGQSGAAAQRRKAGPVELNRVFSKSSLSYKANSNGVSDAPLLSEDIERPETREGSMLTLVLGRDSWIDTGIARTDPRIRIVPGEWDGHTDGDGEQEERQEEAGGCRRRGRGPRQQEENQLWGVAQVMIGKLDAAKKLAGVAFFTLYTWLFCFSDWRFLWWELGVMVEMGVYKQHCNGRMTLDWAPPSVCMCVPCE